MIQKTFYELYKNNSDFNAMAVNPNGEVVEFNYPEDHYTVFVIFRCALDPMSTKRLESFNKAADQFLSEDCFVIGVSRDSTLVLKEWMSEIEKVNFPLVSDMNLGEENIGIPQSLGAPLIDGYPVPTTLILDKKGPE